MTLEFIFLEDDFRLYGLIHKGTEYVVDRSNPTIDVPVKSGDLLELHYSVHDQKRLGKQNDAFQKDKTSISWKEKMLVFGAVAFPFLTAFMTKVDILPIIDSEPKAIDLYSLVAMIEMPSDLDDKENVRLFIEYPSYYVDSSAIYAFKAKEPSLRCANQGVSINNVAVIDYSELYRRLPKKIAEKLEHWYKSESI